MSTTHMGEQTALVQVTEGVLDVAEHLAAVEDPRCGAVTTFIGQVRDHDPQVPGTVTSISYSAHPDAQQLLQPLDAQMAGAGGTGPGPGGEAAGAAGDGSGQRPAEGATADPVRIAASHRIGDLAVGDLALVVCVATAHRARGFEICRTVVERIKVELPV